MRLNLSRTNLMLEAGRNHINASTLKALTNVLNNTRSLKIETMAFTLDGTLLALETSDGEVQVRRSDTGTIVHILGSLFSRVSDVAFSPDGSILALGMTDGFIELWRIEGNDKKLMHVLNKPTEESIYSIAFSPDGKTLVGGGGKKVWLWQVDDGKLLASQIGFLGEVAVVDFASDNKTVAVGVNDGTTGILRLENKENLSFERLGVADSAINRVGFSSDGTMLAAALYDGTIQLWRVSDRTLLQTLNGHTQPVSSIAFSRDGTVLVSGADDGQVQVWRVADGTLLHSIIENIEQVKELTFTPDGTTLAIRVCEESSTICKVQFRQTDNWALVDSWAEVEEALSSANDSSNAFLSNENASPVGLVPATATPDHTSALPVNTPTTAPTPQTFSNPAVNKLLNEIPLIVHHPDRYTCASHNGLNHLLPEVRSGNVIGPHAGDFVWRYNSCGIVSNVLFKIENGSLRLIRENSAKEFCDSETSLSLDTALEMFANGEIEWTGSIGALGRGVESCDLNAK